MYNYVAAIDSFKKPQIETADEYRRILVRLTGKRRRFFQRKYLFDVALGSLMLFLFSPLMLLLWMMVKLTSKGPGFYRQTRVGLNGKPFDVFKLRSMRHYAELDGRAVWCRKGDLRLTGLGKILRTLHLDELPQLLNVMRGEMSLVGPRPERPEICEELKMRIDGYYDRVLVKPGITGLSQINLPPDTCLTDVRRKQVLDLQYINETNSWLEFRILLATTLRMVGIKGETTMNWMRLCRLSFLDEMKPELQPEKKDWKSKQHTHHVANAHQSFARAVKTNDEIDLDVDCDSRESSSKLGSGIGLV